MLADEEQLKVPTCYSWSLQPTNRSAISFVHHLICILNGETLSRMYLEANVASCKRSSKIYFQALALSMVVYWTVAIILNKLNAINNIILLLMIIIIIILLISSNNYTVILIRPIMCLSSSIPIINHHNEKIFSLLPKQKVIPVPQALRCFLGQSLGHQDSNETFQAITAAQRGREAADPLAKFLSDPTQVYLGDKDEMRS